VTYHTIRLSSTVTVARYSELEKSEDRKALAQFVRERFNERYFHPIESTRAHGFTIMAIGCLVIETLEAFYQGRVDTKGESSAMFKAFFKRDTPLKVFGEGNNWFYKHIRCRILQQSEARGGWRILRRGPLLDNSTKSINATRFRTELQRAVDTYANLIVHDDRLWAHFKEKMTAVCDNCV
jgi:hypothetical protein